MLESLFNKVVGLTACDFIYTGVFLRILRAGGICRSPCLNQKQYGMISTKKVCRSGQSTLFTNY